MAYRPKKDGLLIHHTFGLFPGVGRVTVGETSRLPQSGDIADFPDVRLAMEDTRNTAAAFATTREYEEAYHRFARNPQFDNVVNPIPAFQEHTSLLPEAMQMDPARDLIGLDELLEMAIQQQLASEPEPQVTGVVAAFEPDPRRFLLDGDYYVSAKPGVLPVQLPLRLDPPVCTLAYMPQPRKVSKTSTRRSGTNNYYFPCPVGDHMLRFRPIMDFVMGGPGSSHGFYTYSDIVEAFDANYIRATITGMASPGGLIPVKEAVVRRMKDDAFWDTAVTPRENYRLWIARTHVAVAIFMLGGLKKRAWSGVERIRIWAVQHHLDTHRPGSRGLNSENCYLTIPRLFTGDGIRFVTTEEPAAAWSVDHPLWYNFNRMNYMPEAAKNTWPGDENAIKTYHIYHNQFEMAVIEWEALEREVLDSIGGGM